MYKIDYDWINDIASQFDMKFTYPAMLGMMEFHNIVVFLSVEDFTERYDVLPEEAQYLKNAAERYELHYRDMCEMDKGEIFSYLYALSEISVITSTEQRSLAPH